MRTTVALTIFALLCGIAAQAGDRVVIGGRDLFLDDKPHLPHGMVHAGTDQYPTLAKMGINSMHIDVPFRLFDPQKSDEENRRAFAPWVKQADEAYRNGLTVLWLFSFHYTPEWLWERYPDVRMKKHDGTNGSGGWIEMCLDHPGFRADAAKWLAFTAKLLGDHAATLGYLLWNEPHLNAEVCYNKHTIAAFHGWLEARHKTVDALNETLGTKVDAFTDVAPPPPRRGGYWFQQYDKMVSEKAGGGEAVGETRAGNGAVWMDWMRFRQDNFTAFWKWEADVIRANDPGAIVTSKIIPFDLYSSHAHGSGVNTELWTTTFLDALGMDLYSHLDENFLARWKCDYFQGLARGKPIWHTEFNFTFVKERGLAPPEQWRTAFYYQLSRGVNGFWDFMWSDDIEYTVHYKGYKFAPVTHEIVRLCKQMATLAPILAGMKPAESHVAVLHSTTTGLAAAGDYAPTADQTTMIDLLYRSQTPFAFVTEGMVREGALADYRVLVAVGAVALPDDVLDAIRTFTVDNGGHVIANARFAELNEYARSRDDGPGAWMGVRVKGLHRRPREKTGTLELRREARTVENEPIDVHVKLDTWSSKPITLADGTVTGSGTIYGDEDTQQPWSCVGRHELYWEDVEALEGAEVVGTFENGAPAGPALVETPQTLYIARDTCWVDARFETLFRDFLKKSGVRNRNAVVIEGTGEPAPHVDLRMWEGKGRRLLFVINSAPTLHYDGAAVDVEVTFDSSGEVTDALTGKEVPSRWEDFRRVVPMKLPAGAVRVLLGKPYTPGWRSVKEQYDELVKHCRPDMKKYAVWRRSPKELWVYDNRVELGVGMHDVSDEQFELAKRLGIRLVRHTVYWYLVEKTNAAGVYDEEALNGYDDVIERATKSGIELQLVVHGNAPGTEWANRKESYERFAQFMSFAAKRWPSVRFWELWNEMDSTFTDLFGARKERFAQFERGRRYAQMLKLAYPAIKEANPQAQVLVGGISSGGGIDDFIRGIYEEGGRDYFDIMNIHTYGVPVNWGMLIYAYGAKRTMGEYGDFNRPLWNTEFGIDAGNLWAAWRHADGETFDQGQLGQWKSCIEEAVKHRLYAKILPYQFRANNERANDALKDPSTDIELPEGHTIDDYGFGIVRRDGKTPRPTYNWLLQRQVNTPIQEDPAFTTDITTDWDGSWEPVDYTFETAVDKITIKDVEVDSLLPTVIGLRKLE